MSMIKRFLQCAICIICLVAMSNSEVPIEIGSPIPKPDLALTDISGKEITFNSARRANGLLVIFSGNDCPYIERNQTRTTEICNYAMNNNIGVVLVNPNEKVTLEMMKEYAASQQFKWFYVADKKDVLADAFEASHMPECFLFAKTGKLVYHGAIDDSPGNAEAVKTRYLNNAINDMLANVSVKVSTTATIGCNIKRF
jgi:thioredoxin-related protein